MKQGANSFHRTVLSICLLSLMLMAAASTPAFAGSSADPAIGELGPTQHPHGNNPKGLATVIKSAAGWSYKVEVEGMEANKAYKFSAGTGGTYAGDKVLGEFTTDGSGKGGASGDASGLPATYNIMRIRLTSGGGTVLAANESGHGKLTFKGSTLCDGVLDAGHQVCCLCGTGNPNAGRLFGSSYDACKNDQRCAILIPTAKCEAAIARASRPGGVCCTCGGANPNAGGVFPSQPGPCEADSRCTTLQTP